MSAFNCPSCNAHNASNSRFCTACGASLMQAQSQSATPYQTPTSQAEPSLVAAYAFAGFWKRVLAYILDGVIFWLILALIIYLMRDSILNNLNHSPENTLTLIASYAFIYPLWWLYFAIMESSSSQGTFGKKIVGIKVTNLSGDPIGFGHATGRHFAAFITQFTILIGYLMAAFTSRKQTLHDMIASTLVVNSRYGSAQIKMASENPAPGMSVGSIIGVVFLVLLIPVGGIIAAIALPAYQDYTIRAGVQGAIIDTTYIQQPIVEHATISGYWPNTLQQLGLIDSNLNTDSYQIQLAQEGAYHIIFKQPEAIADSRLTFRPKLSSNGDYEWLCSSADIKNNYLPGKCRE